MFRIMLVLMIVCFSGCAIYNRSAVSNYNVRNSAVKLDSRDKQEIQADKPISLQDAIKIPVEGK